MLNPWGANLEQTLASKPRWDGVMLCLDRNRAVLLLSVWFKELGCELSLRTTLLGLAASDLKWPQQGEERASAGVLSNSKDNIKYLKGCSKLLAFLNYRCQGRYI